MRVLELIYEIIEDGESSLFILLWIVEGGLRVELILRDDTLRRMLGESGFDILNVRGFGLDANGFLEHNRYYK